MAAIPVAKHRRDKRAAREMRTVLRSAVEMKSACDTPTGSRWKLPVVAIAAPAGSRFRHGTREFPVRQRSYCRSFDMPNVRQAWRCFADATRMLKKSHAPVKA
jgi:hypothetical protein